MGGFFCGLVCFCFLWLQIWLLSAQKRSWMNTFDMCPKYIKNERALRCTRFVPNYVNAKMGLTWHIMLFGVAVNHNFGLLLCSHLLCVIIMFSYVLICFVLLLSCSLMFSSALCYYYYVLLHSHLLCKCNRRNLMTVLTLCIDVCVPVLWDCVFMLGFRSHQPDFMMLKNSFVFMCIGTYLFYIILFWGVDSFEVFHLVWVQVHFPLWKDKCDRLWSWKYFRLWKYYS